MAAVWQGAAAGVVVGEVGQPVGVGGEWVVHETDPPGPVVAADDGGDFIQQPADASPAVQRPRGGVEVHVPVVEAKGAPPRAAAGGLEIDLPAGGDGPRRVEKLPVARGQGVEVVGQRGGLAADEAILAVDPHARDGGLLARPGRVGPVAEAPQQLDHGPVVFADHQRGHAGYADRLAGGRSPGRPPR